MFIRCNTCSKEVCANEYSAQFCSYWCEEDWKKKNPNKPIPKYINAGTQYTGGAAMMNIGLNNKVITITLADTGGFVIQYSVVNNSGIENRIPNFTSGVSQKLLIANDVDRLKELIGEVVQSITI